MLTLQALVATAIADVAYFLPVWAAALVITAVLSVITAGMALVGKKPARPLPTMDNVKADMAQIRGSAHR